MHQTGLWYDCQTKSLEMREKQAAKEERQKEKKIETSAEKLRKLLKEEKRLKKKRKRSTSSSSSCDSSSDESSSSSSSSNHNRHKKRDRSRSESLRSSKLTPRSSSNQSRKEDSYSPPANTSASFLNQKHEMEKLLERPERLAYQKPEGRDRDRYHSLSRISADSEEAYGGRSEDSKDSYSSSKPQTNSNRTEKQGKMDRFSFDRRDRAGPYRRTSDDKNKAHYSGKLEKDGGRKEPYRKYSPVQTKYSTSPTGSDYSTKSAEYYKRYTSCWVNESSRSSADNRSELARSKREREPKSRERDSAKPKEVDEEAAFNGKEQAGSGARKNLPQNLLNIFNQIAEFQREKGSKQKNQ